MNSPVPPSEADRLAALWQCAILDTPPEERFDRIVRLAARLFDVPVAQIAFLDASRRWVKASLGAVREAGPRAQTLCDHVLARAEVWGVPDTWQDEALAEHPFVVGPPHARFYAAAPVRSPDGYVLGTLSLVDQEPRTWSLTESAALQKLADWVAQEVVETGARSAAAGSSISPGSAEEELHRRDCLLQGVAQATHVLLSCNDFSRALYQAFQRLQAAAQVDRVYLFENHIDPETGDLLMSQRYEWPRSSIGPEVDHPAFQGIPYKAWPGWEEELRTGTPIQGPVRRFADPVREILQAMGTQSILVTPIFIEDKFWGYIGFDDCSVERVWSEGEKSTLLTAANSVGAAYVRERAKKALAESQAQYKAVVESVREVIFQIDAEGRWVFLNPAWTEITGYSVGESLGRRYETFVLAEDRGICRGLWTAVRAGAERAQRCEVRFRTRAGAYRWIEMQARREDHGDGLTGTLYDITERLETKEALERVNDELEQRVAERTLALSKANDRLLVELEQRRRAEEALRRSEQKLSLHAQQSPVAFIEWDLNFRVAEWNPAAESIFGYTRDEALGKTAQELVVPASEWPTVAAWWQALLKRHGGTFGINLNRTRDGRQITCEWINTLLVDEQGDAIGVASLAQDITERRRAEAKIREQAALLDKARDAICVIGLDRSVRYWNKSAERLYGWGTDEVAGRDAEDLLFGASDDGFDVAWQAVMAEEEWTGEMQQVNRSGHDLDVESRWTLVRDGAGEPTAVLIVNTDISEKKALEAQFLRAQRMESLGTLASGIAHDLNNVLGPVLMSAQLLKMRFTDERSQKLLDTLELSAQRGADLVKQVLAFARGADGERVIVHLKSLVGEIARIIQDTFPRSITIETHLAQDLHPVEGDVTQLHQVLMNLCVNARDAMPAGGTLVIRVDNVAVDVRQARLQMDAQPGAYVRISVSDTGMGMAPEVVDKIFEPFYTTKEHGTGLGLSTSVGIVKGHGGFISVQSERGLGTEFEVYLPISRGLQARVEHQQAGAAAPGNGEWILVVDDEAPLRMVAREVLEASGYRVLTAANGAEGVEGFVRHDEPIAAVVTDLMMPVMDGYALIRALHQIDPATPVIATSGLAGQDQLREETGLSVGAFLPKPYKAEHLLQVLHQVLRQEASAPPVPPQQSDT